MIRHPFRWDALFFGLLFLGAVGAWAVWTADLLTEEQLAYAAAGTLIVLGVLGIIGSLVKSKPAPVAGQPEASATETIEEASDDAEETHSQP